jgi:hypothetical protein
MMKQLSRPGLVRSLILGGLLTVPWVASTAGASSGSAHVPSGTIVNSRFVKTFELDDGAFTVTPATEPAPLRSKADATTEMWATNDVGGNYAVAVGFGSVTISRHVAGVPTVTHLRAWVGLVHAGVYHCPAMTSVPKEPRLPSDGWAAVVIGDATGSPDVTFTAASYHCTTLFPAMLQNANEALSVPWRLVAGGVAAQVPYCGQVVGHGESGKAGSMAFTLRIDVQVPEDMAAARKLSGLGHCLPARTVFVPLSASTKTTHAPLGPEPEVTPG